MLASGYTAEWDDAGDFKHRMVSLQRWAYAVAPWMVRAAWRTRVTPVSDWLSPEFKARVRAPLRPLVACCSVIRLSGHV